MGKENYFLIDSVPDRLSKHLISSRDVTRLYNVVPHDSKAKQVLGVSKNNFEVPEAKLRLGVGSVIYDCQSNPSLVSVLSLENRSEESKFKSLLGSFIEKDDGVYYERSYKPYNKRILNGKLVRMAISSKEKRSPEGNAMQYVVLEFSGNQHSSSNYSKVFEEKINKFNRVLKSKVLSVLGNDLKQTIKCGQSQ